MSQPDSNNDPIDMEVRVVDVRTAEVLWRLNPTNAVYDAIDYALNQKPRSSLVAKTFPIDGDPRKVDVVSDITIAKRTIHGLMFDAIVRSR